MNPGLQEQVNDPSVFVQVAFPLLQLRVFSKHSPMSEMRSTHHDVVIVFVYIGGAGLNVKKLEMTVRPNDTVHL